MRSNMIPVVIAVVLLVLGRIPTAESVRAKKVFVHYLPWYDVEGIKLWYRAGWCYGNASPETDCSDTSTVHYSNKPLIGEYTQFDSSVLEYHLLLMYVAGIDGVILNMNPAWDMHYDASLALVQQIVTLKQQFSDFDMKFIVSYDSGETDATLIRTYMEKTYNGLYVPYSDLWFHDDETGYPVYITWSESDPEQYLIELNRLFSDNVLVMVRNAVNFPYSHGNFEWVGYLNTVTTDTPKENTANYGQNYFGDFDWIMARQQQFTPGYTLTDEEINKVMMGNVYPGFDDVNVPDFWAGGINRYIFRDVDDGETLRLTWDRQLQYTPLRLGGINEVENPWVQIVTWNDWPEGTSIEPATDDTYGYRPLETCQEYIPQFKGIEREYLPADLRKPYEIYLLRQDGSDTLAEQEIQTLISGNDGGVHPDPHFTTLGGKQFDYHGVCDLVYLQSSVFGGGIGLDIHLRTQRRTTSEGLDWSAISSVAIRIGSSNSNSNIFEIFDDGTHILDGTSNVTLPVYLADKYSVSKEHISKQHGGHWGYIIDLGFGQSIVVTHWRHHLAINVKGMKGRDFRDVNGLIGNWDNPEKLVGRDGSTDYSAKRQWDEFGKQWQVLAGQGFFSVIPPDDHPQHPEPCSHTENEVNHLYLRRHVDEHGHHRHLQEACNHVVDGGKNDNCLFDVLLTGETYWADAPWYK